MSLSVSNMGHFLKFITLVSASLGKAVVCSSLPCVSVSRCVKHGPLCMGCSGRLRTLVLFLASMSLSMSSMGHFVIFISQVIASFGTS